MIDVDQHYYEPDDCCTRHAEAAFRDRVPRPVPTDSGEREWRFDGRPVRFERWVRDITLAPGAMFDRRNGRMAAELQLVATDTPDFRDRDRRIELLDGWGIDAAVVLPTSGLGWDAEMEDRALAAATMRAYNRWIEDDWGFAYRDRLFAPPFISLLDVGAAVEEVDRVLAAGARMVIVRTGPHAGSSPGDPRFDPVWARIADAGVPVALHVATSGYERALSLLWGEDPEAAHRSYSGFQWFVGFATRAIVDTIAAMIFHNLFGRHPRLRVITIEQGSLWVEPTLRDLDVAYGFVSSEHSPAAWLGGRIGEAPSEIFKCHVSIAPFLSPGFDARVTDLVSLLGADHVVFGSDWPHGEGRQSPLDYDDELADLDDATRRAVLHDNAAAVLGI